MISLSLRKIQQKAFFLAIIICFTGFASDLNSQTATDGEMTFSVSTVTANGNFSPRHVLAIWVEDQAGFVLTRKLRGDKRKEYLYTWNSNSGGNVVDATTGATLSSHQTHTVTWDCRNVNGHLVPDGEYTVFVEFTEEHAQGPLREVTFTKGSEMVSLAPADDANFENIELFFEPFAALTASYTYSVEELAVTFTNTSTGAESYSWDFGDGNSSTAENPVHTFASDGTYTVVLTAVAGSESVTDEQSITVSFTTGLGNSPFDSFQIYPNPTQGIVRINLKDHTGDISIKIFDLKGSLVHSRDMHNPGLYLINISDYENGTYFIQVDSENQSSRQMIIKE
jgi:PKD repeat protein